MLPPADRATIARLRSASGSPAHSTHGLGVWNSRLAMLPTRQLRPSMGCLG